jgi:hypothetical protein
LGTCFKACKKTNQKCNSIHAEVLFKLSGPTTEDIRDLGPTALSLVPIRNP